MNIRAGLGEYILQTYNTIFLKIQWGGLNPLTPLPSGYASGRSERRGNEVPDC